MHGVYFVALLYVVAMFAADRILNQGRRHLTAEDKVRLVDIATQARSRNFLPHFSGLAVIGAGMAWWPERLRVVLAVAYAAFVTLLALLSLDWYGRVKALGVHPRYLQGWLWSRLTQLVAVTAMCVYLVLDW